MLYFSLLIVVLVALDLVSKNKSNEARKNFILVSFLLLVTISGYRDIGFGIDTPGYIVKYSDLEHIQLYEMWKMLFTPEAKDPGFYLFSKLVSLMNFSGEAWIALLSCVFLSSFSYFVYKYSPYPLISFLALICLGYLYFSYSGLRQTLSMSMILFATPLILSRNYIKGVVFLFLAFMFHSSSIVFTLLLPVAFLPVFRYRYAVLAGVIGVTKSFQSNILYLISTSTLLNYSDYGFDPQTLTWSGFLIQFAMFIFADFHLDKSKRDSRIFLNLAFIGLCFQSMSSILAEFFRISLYFSLSFSVLIPLALSDTTSRLYRSNAYYLIVISFILYLVYTGQFSNF